MSKYYNSLASLRENYKSDGESDEESSSEQNEGNHSTKTHEKLPLPECVKNLYVCSSLGEVNDDPDQCQGRIRSFPHERGNWVTSVYIPYSRPKQLHKICDILIENCQSVADFHKCDDFHVSLSRTVILRHHWIDLFVEDLRERLKNIKGFYVDLGTLAIYVNDEGTRTFVALQIQLGYIELLKCVKSVDQSLLEFRLPTYYEDPSFHVSLIWCVGNKKQEIEAILPKLLSSLSNLNDTLEMSPLYVDNISCKIGNKFYNFSLLAKK